MIYSLLLYFPYLAFQINHFIRVQTSPKEMGGQRFLIFLLFLALSFLMIVVVSYIHIGASIFVIPFFLRYLRLVFESKASTLPRSIIFRIASSIIRFPFLYLLLFYLISWDEGQEVGFYFVVIPVVIMAVGYILSLLSHTAAASKNNSILSNGVSCETDCLKDVENTQRSPNLRDKYHTILISYLTLVYPLAYLSKIGYLYEGVKLRVTSSTRSGNLFEFEVAEKPGEIALLQVFKWPTVLIITGIILSAIARVVESPISPEYIINGSTIASLTWIYINFVDGILPDGKTISRQMEALIAIWILIAGGFLPDTQLSQLATRPLTVILLLYIVYHLGWIYGLLLSISGVFIIYSVGTIFRLVQFSTKTDILWIFTLLVWLYSVS